jgi:hypothetical protein
MSRANTSYKSKNAETLSCLSLLSHIISRLSLTFTDEPIRLCHVRTMLAALGNLSLAVCASSSNLGDISTAHTDQMNFLAT